MSYYFTSSSVPANQVKELLEQSFQNSQALKANPPCEDVVPEVITTIDNLIKTGMLGNSEKCFNISVSGHANTNHEKDPHWTNDCVTVSISQV